FHYCLWSPRPSPVVLIVYDLFDSLQSSFFLLGPDYPTASHFSVGCRLCLKEIPSRFIFLEQPVVRFFQVHGSLFIGVDSQFVLLSGAIRFEPVWLHSSLVDEGLSTFDIDAAPDTAGFARRETNSVADVVDTLANTIYPAVAECLVNRFGPRNAWLPRTLPVVADPHCISFGMMLLKPPAKSRRDLKENGFHTRLEAQSSCASGRIDDAPNKLWVPVAVSIVRTEGKTGWSFAVWIDQFGQPLKPFPIFLRTCALAFVFHVASQFAPGYAHCAAQQFIDHVQRNHARKHRVTERFENASYGLGGFKETRVGFDL